MWSDLCVLYNKVLLSFKLCLLDAWHWLCFHFPLEKQKVTVFYFEIPTTWYMGCAVACRYKKKKKRIDHVRIYMIWIQLVILLCGVCMFSLCVFTASSCTSAVFFPLKTWLFCHLSSHFDFWVELKQVFSLRSRWWFTLLLLLQGFKSQWGPRLWIWSLNLPKFNLHSLLLSHNPKLHMLG